MSEFERPIATVDIACFTLRAGDLCVVVQRRMSDPYEATLALPGGYIHTEEDDDTFATANRVLKQKTGLAVPFIEQLAVFSGRERDPRGWSLSSAYIALCPEEQVTGQFDVVPVDRLPKLAFDHNEMVKWAVVRIRGKATYSSLPAFFLPASFTFSELRNVYEDVLGLERGSLDRQNFRRKIEDQEIVEEIPGEFRSSGGRPAQLFRLTDQTLFNFGRQMLTNESRYLSK